jgi:tRNA threonylcarbamoyl adenosine modification protein YeaZ
MEHKPLLAFDCATTGASISLWSDIGISSRQLPQHRQAAELVAEIDALMHNAELDYGKLAAIVTTIGPGSFTGIRIGLATLHGLALVSRVPIKLLTTLEAMAWSVARHQTQFTIALRAGKGELFVQEFVTKNGAPVSITDIYLTPEGHSAWPSPCFGNHVSVDASNYLVGPDATVLCEIATQLPTRSLTEAIPLYIRPPDAKLPNQ